MSVQYELNGKAFKDFGVYVSESEGLVGLLERKNITQYDWAEYHGISPNLTKPKYKEREIQLSCFIRGENWEDLFEKFQEFLIGEFSKSGTQRLHIKPFGGKTLAYEVFCKDEIKPEKTFKEGEMFATFNIKLIEPNPIKKVLITDLDKFKLKYESKDETEIFFGDGTKQTARGNVNFTKNYESPSYEGSGINLISTSAINADFYEAFTIPTEENTFRFSVDSVLLSAKNIMLIVIGRKPDNSYQAIAVSEMVEGMTGTNSIDVVAEVNMSLYGKFIYKVVDEAGQEITGIVLKNANIETAEINGEWQDMIGKEKIIIIAGKIEEIKNFESEADVLWEKL